MARTTRAFEDKIKRAIRDFVAFDPLLTQTALIEQLDKKFIDINGYTQKL